MLSLLRVGAKCLKRILGLNNFSKLQSEDFVFAVSQFLKSIKRVNKLSKAMSSKKGLDLLKAIGKYMTETEGFDKVLRNVSFCQK